MNITSPFARAAFEQSSAQVQLCYSDSYSDGAANLLSIYRLATVAKCAGAGVDVDIPDFDGWDNDTEVFALCPMGCFTKSFHPVPLK